MASETEKLEFKEIAKDELYKGVVAFANTDGGTIIVGITNAGETAPLADVDDVYTRVTNGVRDAIAPDVTVFVKYTLEEDNVIRIEIGEGSYKPYYLKSKGLKPSGVYVRQGASSVPVSSEQIRQMIKNADGDVFEELRSMKQVLTFQSCSKTFSDYKTAFGEEKFAVLGIRNNFQGLFTNLGLLLSDQCAHTVKVAVFSDGGNTVFRDRKEFTGSVFAQLEETFAYLQLCNQNRSVINGLARTDYWDYPEEALREALVNALIHRDYSFSGSIIINVNEKRIEFISVGGLLAGLLPEDILNGISQLRNRNLADAFLRLNII
ncbi:MAG: putative DNA binding domain-containing protein, partial [Clostridiales bacterium]|nr:putative DNA binding domain-containing protein [Clostridiales bacterium]